MYKCHNSLKKQKTKKHSLASVNYKDRTRLILGQTSECLLQHDSQTIVVHAVGATTGNKDIEDNYYCQHNAQETDKAIVVISKVNTERCHNYEVIEDRLWR